MIILCTYLLGILPFFQDYLASFFNLILGKNISLMILVLKDIIVIYLFCFFTFKLNHNKVIFYINLLILLAFIYFLYSIVKFGDISSSIASIRAILICFMAISVGFYSFKKINFNSFFITITYLAIITGFLDLIFSDELWFKVNITDFITNVKNDPIINGLPANMYGDLGNGWFSTRRLVGFTGVPLTYGYLLIPLIAYWFNRIKSNPINYYHILIFLTLLFLLYFTYTRAAYIAVALIMFLSIRSVFKKIFIIFLPIIILIITPKFHDILINAILDGSTALHIFSVIEGFKQISFIGSGIGQVGIFAQRYGGEELSLENSFLFILLQLGIPYFVLYLGVCILILNRLKNSSEYPFKYFFIGIMLTGLVSEQLFSPTSIILSYMIIGYGLFKSTIRIKNNEL